jgi:Fe-S-cluster containining protein
VTTPAHSLAPLEGDPDPNGDDCVACGRCCHHSPKTVSLLEADEDRMGALLPIYTEVEPRPPYFRFIKNDGAHCGALDVSKPGLYPCAIYAVRPQGCRTVEPGSPCCLEARRLGHLGSSVEFTRVV